MMAGVVFSINQKRHAQSMSRDPTFVMLNISWKYLNPKNLHLIHSQLAHVSNTFALYMEEGVMF